MNQFIVVCMTIVLSLSWRMLAPKKLRDFMMPWTFAYLFFNFSCICFMPGMYHTVVAITNYLATAILVDGFATGDKHRNGSWGAFLCFWAYMIFSCIYGYHKFMGMVFWINAFLVSYGSGYYFSRWLVNNPHGMKKLQIAFIFFTCVMACLYISHGGVAAVDETGRATLDLETMHADAIVNENHTAMMMLAFIPFLIVFLFADIRMMNEKLCKVIVFCGLVFCGVVLFRTGSRNGAVGLLPSLWYVLFSTTNKMKRKKRILLFVIATIVFVPIMLHTMRGAGRLRIFDFSGAELERTSMEKADMVSSGRWTMWKMHVDNMSALDCIIGRGIEKKHYIASRGQATVGNAHSAFMTVFYNSGFVGLLLLFAFLMHSLFLGLSMGDRGRIALLMIGTWLLCGVGESLPIQGGTPGVLAGLGMGLLCAGPVKDEMLMNNHDRRLLYGDCGMRGGHCEDCLYR